MREAAKLVADGSKSATARFCSSQVMMIHSDRNDRIRARLGFVTNDKTELRRTADAAAWAGEGEDSERNGSRGDPRLDYVNMTKQVEGYPTNNAECNMARGPYSRVSLRRSQPAAVEVSFRTRLTLWTSFEADVTQPNAVATLTSARNTACARLIGLMSETANSGRAPCWAGEHEELATMHGELGHCVRTLVLRRVRKLKALPQGGNATDLCRVARKERKKITSTKNVKTVVGSYRHVKQLYRPEQHETSDPGGKPAETEQGNKYCLVKPAERSRGDGTAKSSKTRTRIYQAFGLNRTTYPAVEVGLVDYAKKVSSRTRLLQEVWITQRGSTTEKHTASDPPDLGRRRAADTAVKRVQMFFLHEGVERQTGSVSRLHVRRQTGQWNRHLLTNTRRGNLSQRQRTLPAVYQYGDVSRKVLKAARHIAHNAKKMIG